MTLEELQLLRRIVEADTGDFWYENYEEDLKQADFIIQREINLKTMNVRKSKEDDEADDC